MFPYYMFSPDVIRTFDMGPGKPICLRNIAEKKGVRYALRRKALLQGIAVLVRAGLLDSKNVGLLWTHTLKRYPFLKAK